MVEGGTWGTVAPRMCQQLGAGTALAAPSSPVLTHPFHSAPARLLSHPVFTAQTLGVLRDLSWWHHPAGGTWWPAQVPRAAGISPGDAQVSGFRGNPCPHPGAHGAEPTLSLSGLAAARGAHPRTPNPAHPPQQQWQGSPWPNASQLLAGGSVPGAGGGFLVAGEGQDNKTGKN